MRNSWQKSADVISRHCAGLLLAFSYVWTNAAFASTPDPCSRIETPGKKFIYLADEALKRITGTTISLGPVNLSETFEIKDRFFLISSKNLIGDAGLGGREMTAQLEPSSYKCPNVNILSITISFDSSSLPPGAFSVDYPFFGRKLDGSPDASAEAYHLAGFMKRVWLQAEVDSDTTDHGVVRLKNTGNIPSNRIGFGAPPKSSYLRVVRNACDQKMLSPGDVCDIEFSLNGRVEAKEEIIWRAGFEGSETGFGLSLITRPSGVQAFITNR